MVLSVRIVAWQLLLQAEAEAPLPIAERVLPLGPSFVSLGVACCLVRVACGFRAPEVPPSRRSQAQRCCWMHAFMHNVQ